jgi:hypothetical protein
VDDIIPMAIIQRTPDLPRKLPGNALSQPPMADDIIQHLPTIDVLEDHVVMMLVHDHLTHAADVGMMKEHRERCFA